jgi:hypothetical protein
MHGVTWEHIEHILPKSLFPRLVVEWDNLTLACPMCNNAKLDYFNAESPILNPYNDVIIDHIQFVGSLPFPVLSDATAKRTITILKLDRADLTFEREQRIKQVNRLLEEWSLAEVADKGWIADGIRIDASSGEFSACVRAFLVARDFPI